MSSILLSMIHDKAMANKPDVEITALNYHIWVDHWFKTAEQLAKEFNNAGLVKTHDAVINIIIEQKRFYK